MKAAGITPPLPPNPAPYLVDWLMEVGPTSSDGLSAGPVAWEAIAAWSALTCRSLLPWEARILRQMSRDFAAEVHAAKKPDAPAPWVSLRPSIHDREGVARRVGNAFKVLMQAKRGGKPK